MAFDRAEFDNYWRIKEPFGTRDRFRRKLEGAGYEPKTSLTRADLLKLVIRHEKGFICYDTCDDQELKKFAIDRGIISLRQKPTRKWLVDTLTQADEERTFHQFTALPSELRLQIYGLHLADFTDRALYLPAQPPIARTCQLLRTETLPIFYRDCTIQLRFQQDLLNNRTRKYLPHPLTQIFLYTLNAERIARIRKLSIDLRQYSYGGGEPLKAADVKVSFEQGYDLQFEATENCRLPEARQDMIVDNVSQTLQEMIDREEVFTLRVQDVSKIFDAIRSAWE